MILFKKRLQQHRFHLLALRLLSPDLAGRLQLPFVQNLPCHDSHEVS